MSFRPRPAAPEQELRAIDARLAQYGPEMKTHRDTLQGSVLRKAIDDLLDRRFTLRPVVHRCTSEENWSVLSHLEQELS